VPKKAIRARRASVGAGHGRGAPAACIPLGLTSPRTGRHRARPRTQSMGRYRTPLVPCSGEEAAAAAVARRRPLPGLPLVDRRCTPRSNLARCRAQFPRTRESRSGTSRGSDRDAGKCDMFKSGRARWGVRLRPFPNPGRYVVPSYLRVRPHPVARDGTNDEHEDGDVPLRCPLRCTCSSSAAAGSDKLAVDVPATAVQRAAILAGRCEEVVGRAL